MNAAENSNRSMVAHFTNFDLDRLMNESWDNLGEDGQKALIDDCYQMLRYRNPGADELVLYNQAKQFARQQSDLRLYNLAVEKNMPKGNLEYLMRKIGDMNLLMNVSKGLAVSSADGKTGDMAANEAANEIYRQDGHKILDVTGMVAGFALDPTTWLSAGVGSAATRGTMWLRGRWLAGRGASAAVTQAATRQFATSMTGRIVGGIAGGAANFGTFEGVKEVENQFAHGGKVATMDENGNLLREGRYVNEGYSAGAVAGQFGHGLLMGGAVGWLGPVSGNVSDKLVRATSSTVGKVATRAGVYTGATLAEGTIFSVPEWIDGKRDAMDVWNDNMAMMVGFKAKHMIKSAGGVLGDLKASFDSPANGRKNRLDFESRLRMRMDAPSDVAMGWDENGKKITVAGMGLTKDEVAELKRYGYSDLRELVESAERAKADADAENAAEIVSRLTDMVYDTRVSEAARAKMYYYATGRRLPMSTVMRGELVEDGDDGFIVESQGANGVITSRRFKSRKSADLELERINRQVELNSIELGERYRQTVELETRLQDACRSVADENGWDAVEVYRLCEEARRNHQRGDTKEYTEATQSILRKVLDAMGEFEETGVTDEIRARLDARFGVSIDDAIRKDPGRRKEAEQAAIEEYIRELLPEKAKENNPVEDVRAEDLSEQEVSEDNPERTAETDWPEEAVETAGPGQKEDNPEEQRPIGRAVMKYQDREVEVLQGRIVLTDDGTMIDNAGSDQTIIIRDVATGKIEMVSPEAILTYEPYAEEGDGPSIDPADAGSPKYERPGRIKVRNADGTETRGWLTGYVDEDGRHEYYVEGDLQHLRYATEDELDGILVEYEPDESQAPDEPQAPAPETPGNSEDLARTLRNMVFGGGKSPFRLPEEDGSEAERQEKIRRGVKDAMQGIVSQMKDAEIASALRGIAEKEASGELTNYDKDFKDALTLEAYQRKVARGEEEERSAAALARTYRDIVFGKADDNYLARLGARTAEDADIQEKMRRGVADALQTQMSRMTESQIEMELGALRRKEAEGLTPYEEVYKEALTAEHRRRTPLTRIPVGKDGRLRFTEVSPAMAWDALVEKYQGKEDRAQGFADNMVAIKTDALKKAERKKIRPTEDPDEYDAQMNAYEAEVAAARAELEGWQSIAGEQARRERERQDRIAREEEARRAAEAKARAEAERKRKAAEEEAERKKREMLKGVPEWLHDTPADARARGFRRDGPEKVDRQGEIEAVEGKEVEVKFGKDEMAGGRVVIIEASQLQPSHIQGRRNPLHFIDEAQPKERTDKASVLASQKMAANIRPEEITSSVTAYTGAPTVNRRGETIQGNSRSDALRYMYESEPEQAKKYRQYLTDHAQEFGVEAADIERMEHPVVVNMLDVSDEEAIRLGQYEASDTESGGVERIKAKNAVQKMGARMRSFANVLLQTHNEEASLSQLIERNGVEALKWMADNGIITETQYQSAFDSRGNLSGKGAEDLRGILFQSVFRGGSTRLEELFESLPAKAQRAILSTSFRDYDSPEGERMIEEVQQSVMAYHDMMQYEAFATAGNVGAAVAAADAWARQYVMDDAGEMVLPSEKFSNFAVRLAALYRGGTQSFIQKTLNDLYDAVQSTGGGTLFDAGPSEPMTLAEAIKKVLGIEYEPKNRKENGENGGMALGERDSGGESGRPRGPGDAGGGERGEEKPRGAERGGGTSGDGGGRGTTKQSSGNARGDGKRTDNLQEGETPEADYRLSDEIDGNGRPFVLNSKGEIEFGRIDENVQKQTGLTPAPILLSEGIITNPKTNEGYGLIHIEARHGEQIRANGYTSALEFIEDVAANWQIIKEAKDRRGNPTYRLIAQGKHNNTLMIELSGDGTYWNINTAGIFKTSYGKNAKELYNRHTTDKQSAETDGASQESEQSGTTDSSRMSAPATPGRKVNNPASEKQGKGEESSDGGEAPLSGSALNSGRAPLSGRRRVPEGMGHEEFDESVRGWKKNLTEASDEELREIVDKWVRIFEDEDIDRFGATYVKTVAAEELLEERRSASSGRGGAEAGEAPDSGMADGDTIGAKIAAAEAEVNTSPTPAQAEAGNYKKGHVTIGEFDITIENPAGSVRKGVDADGKEWSSTMANTYGYIKGTEGVDGDHIDVFLHSDMDQWNGRKVFVVDQTNTDGSFDEHKVMLGFNDKDEAMTAYLANYDKTWADTHPGLRISETNIEDFNKWIESSHRKTKPFADYTTVSKVVDEAPVKTEPEHPAQPEANIGEGYKIEPKPYTNKQGKTLDTYLVTFDRDFSKEELSALRAKAKALKGWYDRESKGWMLRSSDDAKAFADDVTAKSEDEVADEAPLSMADMEKSKPTAKPKKAEAPAKPTESPMKQVDVEGVFDALKTKGETKLSDHAKPVEAPKPKKRRWISDEDADEFDSLRKDLRSHFGKDGDIVQEAGAEYGKPKPKQMDAEVLRMGTRMTYLMMKGGLRSFSDYCEAMKDELPDIFDDMRPHLKSLYAAAQNMEEVIELGWDEEMDDRKTVKAFDVYNFDKPGAKDIIATAQHAVDENASQQQTDQIIQTLKDQRNEQRKKEADETSADTETIIDKAEATASQVESKLEAANSEEDAEGLSRSLDKEIEEVNKQLALLGYYEADPVDKDFNEAYGYMRNAERKAVQDAHRLATQLAADLGITIDPKDKVRKAKYGFGSKIARSNVAPAGGEVYITLPLTESRELSIWLSLDKAGAGAGAPSQDHAGIDDLELTGIMYRIEKSDKGGMDRYESSNHHTRPDVSYDELLADIRRLVRAYLPEELVRPAASLTPQPGEDYVDMARRVAEGEESEPSRVEREEVLSGLFGGLIDSASSSRALYDRTVPATPEAQRNAIARIIDFAKRLKNRVERAVIGGITQRQKADLAQVGVDIDESWVHSFETSAVSHNQKHHGNAGREAKRNQMAITSEDYARIPDILEDYDKVSKSSNKTKGTENEVIIYEKEFEDGYVYYLEEKRDNRKSLAFHTMYKKKKGTDSSDGFAVNSTAPITPVAPSDNLSSKSDSKVNKKTLENKENEGTEVRPRTEAAGRGGQQPRPDEPLGEGAKNEAERTDGGRMAQRSGEHSVSDTGRGAGVSGLHQSERSVTAPRIPAAPKNTRNNHAERGTDYAPKGEKARIDANIAALELAKKLIASGATATPQEMAILRRYSGWGGLGAAFNEGSAWAPNPINKRLRDALTPEEYQAAVMSRNSAYYTPAAVIDAMWDVAKALGFKVEKARAFDPFGHAGLTPLGEIRMTLAGEIKMTPVEASAGEFFVALRLLVLARRGSISKTTEYDCKIKKHPSMLRSRNGNKRDGQHVSPFPQHRTQVCPAVHFKRQDYRTAA